MYFLCCFYVFLCCFYVFFVLLLCIDSFVTFSVLFVCICVLNYCHRVATQLQLNIYHIKSLILPHILAVIMYLLYWIYFRKQR